MTHCVRNIKMSHSINRLTRVFLKDESLHPIDYVYLTLASHSPFIYLPLANKGSTKEGEAYLTEMTVLHGVLVKNALSTSSFLKDSDAKLQWNKHFEKFSKSSFCEEWVKRTEEEEILLQIANHVRVRLGTTVDKEEIIQEWSLPFLREQVHLLEKPSSVNHLALFQQIQQPPYLVADKKALLAQLEGTANS